MESAWRAAPARLGRQEKKEQEQEQELLVRHPVRVGGDLGQPQAGEQRLHRQQRARDFVSGFGSRGRRIILAHNNYCI